MEEPMISPPSQVETTNSTDPKNQYRGATVELAYTHQDVMDAIKAQARQENIGGEECEFLQPKTMSTPQMSVHAGKLEQGGESK